jgi:serine/threonine protein kinase
MLLEYVGGGTLTQFMDDSETPAQDEQIMRFWTGLLDLTRPLMRLHRLPLMEEGRPDLQGLVLMTRLVAVSKLTVCSIHHDIKPDNILVTARFGPSRFDVMFKLADLGLTEFDYVIKRSGERASKNNSGTQMFSTF